jgi:exosortase
MSLSPTRARKESSPESPVPVAVSLSSWIGPLLVVIAFGWAYLPILPSLWREWQNDPNYSVGQLVPLAAMYVAWNRRRELRATRVAPCWLGFIPLVAAQLLYLAGMIFLFQSAERFAFLLTVASLVLLLAGTGVFWKLRWVLLFLLLMMPPPGRLHNLISGPLQDQATAGAVFVLETLGVHVVREGHVLMLNDAVPVAVAEACSGLRMLMAFIVVAVFMAFIANRPTWQRAFVVISSVPVAIVCNLLRLVATAALYMYVSSDVGKMFFHDFAGLSMMPLAIAILLGELWLLNRIVVPDAPPPSASRRVGAEAGRPAGRSPK